LIIFSLSPKYHAHYAPKSTSGPQSAVGRRGPGAPALSTSHDEGPAGHGGALIYPEAPQAHRGKKSETSKLLETEKLSEARISQARTVLAHSRRLAESVLAGLRSFDDSRRL
jgi:hypothetical protein